MEIHAKVDGLVTCWSSRDAAVVKVFILSGHEKELELRHLSDWRKEDCADKH